MDKIDQMSKELMRYFPVSSKVAIDNPPVIDVFFSWNLLFPLPRLITKG